MLPEVYDLLAGDGLVAELVGTRIYRHGDAPQGVSTPYVTWFVVSGTPENELSGGPRIDAYSVQVDCWADRDALVEEVATAVRDAIELRYHMTAVVANDRDRDTMRYRIGMTFSFWTSRP